MRLFLSENGGESDLIRFVFDKKGFDASTPEFSKNNKMYDVVKTKISGDSIIVFCFSDEEETRLSADFNILFFQNTNAKGDFEKETATFFKQLDIKYLFEKSFHLKNSTPSVFEAKKSVLTYKTPVFSTTHLDILTPPPQLIG